VSVNKVKAPAILGVEDGRIPPKGITYALLAGVLLKKFKIKDLRLTLIQVDGLDATLKLLEMVAPIKSKIDMIMLGGVSFAGFNLIDPVAIHEELKVPIIVISKDKPNNEEVYRALVKHFNDWTARWSVFEKLSRTSKIYEVVSNPKERPIYVEVVGISAEEASSIIRSVTIWGRLPEPIRAANLVAKGLSSLFLSEAKLRDFKTLQIDE